MEHINKLVHIWLYTHTLASVEVGGKWGGEEVHECTWFSCRNRWPELCRDDHRENGGQEPVKEGKREMGLEGDG